HKHKPEKKCLYFF
ncbi:hypothetical protein DERP_014849, partial [Dermatophagoides pteronyssinus]